MDYFFQSVGNVIISTDKLIFFRRVGIPPTSHVFMALFYPHGILTYHRDGRHDGTAAAAAISAPNHSDPRTKWLAKNNSMILDDTG